MFKTIAIIRAAGTFRDGIRLLRRTGHPCAGAPPCAGSECRGDRRVTPGGKAHQMKTMIAALACSAALLGGVAGPARAGGRVVIGPTFQGHWHGHGHRHWGGIGLGIAIGAPLYYGYRQAPYYYDDAGVLIAPAPLVYAAPVPAVPPMAQPAPILYPRNGQSAAQLEADRRECDRWAVTQPAAMADANVFHRATLACMDGRGYTVR